MTQFFVSVNPLPIVMSVGGRFGHLTIFSKKMSKVLCDGQMISGPILTLFWLGIKELHSFVSYQNISNGPNL